jgi:dienelactone hydrolase
MSNDGAQHEVVVEDIVYDGDVSAWLVRPAGAAPGSGHAGIVLWHWLSTEEPIGTRDEFLDEARELARRGAVCLLPAGRFPWSIRPSGSAADIAQIAAEVGRFAEGLGLLRDRPDVDPERLAVVGHDFGAMLAVLAGAADPAVRAAVLVAPTPRWADWFLPFWDIAEQRMAYLAALEPHDPISHMPGLATRPLLIQMAERDFYVPVMAAYELRAAAGDAAEDLVRLKTYDAEHDMGVEAARNDRLAFLQETLGLT